VSEITRGRGQQFDPDVVDAFLGISEEAAVEPGARERDDGDRSG
jgi:HD-GYP domain-containing protein (c-di-GMP phosphodiesterase class II)